MPPKLIKQMVGAAVGLVIGLMILYIGFFRTLLLVILGGLGWWLCGSRSVPQSMANLMERLKNMRR